MKSSEMNKFYEQYKADAQDGFVSNIDSYCESMLKGLSSKEIKEVVEELKKRLHNEIKYLI